MGATSLAFWTSFSISDGLSVNAISPRRLACSLSRSSPKAVMRIRGGNSTRRRVRLGHKTIRLQLRQIVSYRCAGHLNRAMLEDGARTHRLSGTDVLLHEGLENDGAAVVKH